MVGKAQRSPLLTLGAPLECAVALQPHLLLHSHRGSEGRNGLADDLVLRRPLDWLVPQVLIPDLADAGIVPADHIVAGLRGTDDSKARDSDADSGTEGGSVTHEESPGGKYAPTPARRAPRRCPSFAMGRIGKSCGKSVTDAS